MANRVFVSRRTIAELKAGKRPHFDYPVAAAGATANFNVYSATSLGAQAKQVAQAVLQRCEADGQTLSGFFGVPQMHCNLILAPLSPNQDGSGGAYHHSCIASDLYCDVQFTPAINTDLTNALVVAEEVEVYQATQNQGWDCGSSNGEGLSRVLAEALYPKVLDSYETSSAWIDTTDRPDWVSKNNNTDSDAVSNGCSVLFLFWLNTELNFSWQQICRAGAPTLAGTYQALTGKNTAYADFRAVIDKMFPLGQPSNVQVDNPFVAAMAAGVKTKKQGK
ncbi:MAG TPA: hypothetical protein VG096_16655 [Bryobacteraceae bacterium]|jgi:hypothetical protein|nr:hypothetical protein [Bryobacteraceae bacterium]